MCLVLEAIGPATDRDTLVAAASQASSVGLHVDVGHPSRWPWAKGQPVRARISEDGSCACSLLSDVADWNAETWSMRCDVLDRLATTFETLAAHGPRELVIEARWVGDPATVTVRVSPRELADLARSSKLGTRTRYVVVVDK